MSLSRFGRVAQVGVLALATALGAAACSSADEAGEQGAVAADVQDVTAATCGATIEKKVLDRARKISDTARIISTKTLYGGDKAYADAVLVRVSDETEPSDYIVVRSRLENDVVDKGTCAVKHVSLLAEGLLPGDDLVRGTIGDACDKAMRASVLAQAKAISDTASVTGVKLVYGGDSTFGGVAVIRVSDETEPSDYVAVFTVANNEEKKAGACRVELTELLNEGLLPRIPGL